MKVRIINKNESGVPAYQTEKSAGMDLLANESMTLQPLERKLIGTGLYLELPSGYEAQIRPRSGLAYKHGITVLNSPATIDADYRGEIKVLLFNCSNEKFKVNKGDRIAQMVIAAYTKAEFVLVETLESTVRGEGGFGSTGK
jgi:dUTP pyrophosphatase